VSVRTSTWKAVADFSQLIKGPKTAEASLQSLRQEADRTSTALVKSLQNIEDAGKRLGTSSTTATGFSAALRKGMSEASKSATDAARQITKAGKDVEAAARDIKASGSTASQAASGYEKAGSSASAAGSKIRKAGTDAASSKAAFESAASGATKAENAARKSGSGASEGSAGWLRLKTILGETNGVFVTIPNSAAAATAGVLLLAKAAAATGIAFNATQEQSLVAFTTILKDGGKAQKLMQDIVETARVTPFATEDIVKSVRQLLAFGLPLDKILKGAGADAKGLVITLGNAVAAMGGGSEMIETANRAIGQMFAKGKVSAEELQQLAEAGIPVYAILQEELGLTAKQVQNIGDAGISATVAIDALTRGMDKRFGGAMEKQSKTFKGIISTIKDNIEIGLGKATEGLFNKLKASLGGFGDFLTDFNKRVEKVGFMQALEEKAPAIASILEMLTDAGGSLVDILKELGPAASSFLKVLSATGLGTVMLTLRAISIILQTIAGILDAIPDPIKTWLGAILGVVVAAKSLGSAFDKVKGIMTAIAGTKAVTFMKDLVGTFKAAKAANVAMTMNPIAGALEGVAASAGKAKGGITGLFPAIGGLSSGVVAATAGIAALAIGLVLLIKALKPNYEAQQTSRDAANQLTKSLNLQEGAVKKVTAATRDNTQANKDNRQSNDKFAQENEKTISRLKDLRSELEKMQYLRQIGFELVQRGVKPEEVLASLNRLANEAGIKVPIELDVKDLYDMKPVLKGIQGEARGIAMSFDHAWDSFHEVFGSSDELDDLHNRIGDVAQSAKDLASKDAIGAAISQMAAFEVGVDNAATEAEHKRDAMLSFAGALQSAFGDKVDFGKFEDVKGLLTNVAGGAKGASKQFQDYAKAVLKAAKANGGDLTDAIDEVNRKYPELAGAIIEATDAQEKFNTAGGKTVAVYKANEEAVAAYQQTLDSFRDFGAALNASFTPMEKVSDTINRVVKDAGDGMATLSQMNDALVASATKAGEYRNNLDKILATAGPADGLPIIQMIKDMGEKGPQYAAMLANGTADQLHQLSTNIQNAGPEVATSWAQFAATLQQQIQTQNEFTRNLLTLEAMGFTALAEQFRIKGPEAAAALAQAVKAPVSDLQAMEDQLNSTTNLTAADLDKMKYAIQLFSQGGITNIRDFAKAMGTDIDGAYKIIAQLRDLIKGFPPEIRTQIDAQLNAIAPPPVTIIGTIKILGTPGNRYAPGKNGGRYLEERGGVLDFYGRGGTNIPMRAIPSPGAYENRVAQIAPAGAMRVWAEPETGGEAYVPLAKGKRRRSLGVLDQVLRRFDLPDIASILGMSKMVRVLAMRTMSGGGVQTFKRGGMTLGGRRDDISKMGYRGFLDTGALVSFFKNYHPTFEMQVPEGQSSSKMRDGGLAFYGAGAYVVQRGDTLSGIGAKLGIPWRTLYDQNRGTIGSNPNRIMPGMRLNYDTGGGGGAAAPNDAGAQARWNAVWRDAGANLAIGGPSSTTSSLSSIWSDVESRKQQWASGVESARKQAWQDVSGQAAPDNVNFRPDDKVTLADFGKDLKSQVSAMQAYQFNLQKIASIAGGDVAQAIRDMGDAGIELAGQLAVQGTPAILDMANSIKQLGEFAKQSISEFNSTLRSSIKDTQAFNDNLLKLAQMGFGDLATQLSGMGAEGESLAAQAAQSPGYAAETNALIQQQNAQGQLNVNDLIKLISWVTGQSGSPGLRDAGRGTGFTDAYIAKLVTQNLARFSQTPHAASLIAEAKKFMNGQFYAGGGINLQPHMRSAGQGPITWGEYTAGGESWIPHARSKRGNALKVWAQTGAILGAGGFGAQTHYASGGFGAYTATTPRAASSAAKDPSVFNQHIEFNTAIYNPTAEKSSESINRVVTNKAQLGVFGRSNS
jgi:tape measure domain-containing protein